MTQIERISRLITRARGATALEIIQAAGTVSPNSRLAELKARGWHIERKPVKGRNYGRYHGTRPNGSK